MFGLPDLEEKATHARSTTQGTKVPKDKSSLSARDPDWLVEDEGERVVGHLAKSKVNSYSHDSC